MPLIRSACRVYIVETNRCYSSREAIGLQLEDAWMVGNPALESIFGHSSPGNLTKSADSRYSLPAERMRAAPRGWSLMPKWDTSVANE